MADYSIDTSVIGPVTSDVTADVTSTLAGLDDMSLTLAGGTTTTLAGENTVHSDARLTLEPVTTTSAVTTTSSVESTSSLDTRASVDVKPVAVDSCVRLELAPPPPTEVHSPYEQRWAWSVLGLEVFALEVSGSASTHIRPDRHDPVVIEI